MITNSGLDGQFHLPSMVYLHLSAFVSANVIDGLAESERASTAKTASIPNMMRLFVRCGRPSNRSLASSVICFLLSRRLQKSLHADFLILFSFMPVIV